MTKGDQLFLPVIILRSGVVLFSGSLHQKIEKESESLSKNLEKTQRRGGLGRGRIGPALLG